MGRTSSLLSSTHSGLYFAIRPAGQTTALAAPHPLYRRRHVAAVQGVRPAGDTRREAPVLSRRRSARLDGNRWLASHLGTATFRCWAAARDRRIQYTFPEHSGKGEGQDFAPRLSPSSASKLAFVSTRDGGPPQIYVMGHQFGGEARGA
jgi:hypothetical protein